MNNDIGANKLQEDTKSKVKKIDGLISELEQLGAELSSNLSEIKVRVDYENNPGLYESIQHVFGKVRPGSADYGFITFEMYLECIKLVRLAGRARGISSVKGYK